MIEFCLLDLVIVIVAKIFCILFHLPFPYCAKKNTRKGWGVLMGILGRGVPPGSPNPDR